MDEPRRARRRIVLDTVPLRLFATQTAPLAYATPAGAPPNLIVCTLPVRGSKRVTVPPVSVAQMLPAPTARAVQAVPDRDRLRRPVVARSTRSSSPVSWLVTQTAPAPTAMPVGALSSGMVGSTSPVAASILDSVSLVTLATQTDPYPDAIALGPIPGRDHHDLRSGAWVDLGNGAVELVGHPDLAVGDRDAGWSATDRDAVDDLPGRVDPEQEVIRAIGDPDGSGSKHDPIRPPDPGHDSAKAGLAVIDHADGVRASGQMCLPAASRDHEQRNRRHQRPGDSKQTLPSDPGRPARDCLAPLPSQPRERSRPPDVRACYRQPGPAPD